MKMKFKKLLADGVFFAGHYGSKASNALIELGLKLHVDFDTDTGRKILAVRQELLKRQDQSLQAKPQAGGQYVRGQSIFVRTNKPGSS